MKTGEVTEEEVRLRLMELFPDVHSSVGVDLWNHGGLIVHLSVHPKDVVDGCWSIRLNDFGRAERGEPIESRKREMLARALEMAERGEWKKPSPQAAEALATVHAG